MIEIKIGKEIKELCPNSVLGVIQAKVRVTESLDDLLKIIDNYCNVLEKEIKLEELTSDFRIRDGREAYKKLGKSPGRYRMSSEALLRRIIQGKGLYRINNIVDINNFISIKSHFPVGSYDTADIEMPIILHRAEDGTSYKGIGKEVLNIEHLPVLCDEKGAFGSTTSDSERAMVRKTSQEIIMCIYSFSGEDGLKEYLEEAKGLFEKYADGKEFEISIVR